MSGLLSFLQSEAPQLGQVAATAVQDFAGGAPAMPTIPLAQPGQQVLPIGTPIQVPPGTPPGTPLSALGTPAGAPKPAPQGKGLMGAVAKVKALPLPTKLIGGGVVALAAYHFLGGKRRRY